MAVKFGNRVKETTTTTGTGTLTLGGADTGFRSFADEFTTGDAEISYLIVDNPNQPVEYEYGKGTFTTGSFARDTVEGSSNSGSKVDFGAGIKTIIAAPTAGDFTPFTSVISARGDLIRGSSTATAERLALGATGSIVRSDGTDIGYLALGSTNNMVLGRNSSGALGYFHQGMELVEYADLTNGGANDLANYELTHDMEAGYKYLLDIRALSSTNASWYAIAQFRDSGGTLHATAGDYRSSGNAGAATGVTSVSAAHLILYNHGTFSGNTATIALDASLEILEAMTAGIRTRVQVTNQVWEAATTAYGIAAGIRDANEADQNVLVGVSVGTMDSGEAFLYRIKEPS